MKRSVVAWTMVVCAFAAPLRAEPSEADRGLAQSLFDSGKALMERGDYDQACPKLAESQRLDPGGGTILNLALCHELQGKLSAAWTEFKQALGDAQRDGRQDRIAAAEEHLRIVETKLPWVTITVASAAPGQEVKLDGALLGQPAWGTAVAVDPGAHELSATAPGREPWSGRLELAPGERKTVAVPELRAAATPRAATPAPSPPVGAAPTSWKAPPAEDPKQSAWISPGRVVAGVGTLGLLVGTIAGINAIQKHKESNRQCPTDTTCTPEGVKLENQARTSAWTANVALGLGLVGVSVGFVLMSSSGGNSAARPARLALEADADTHGRGRVKLKGTF